MQLADLNLITQTNLAKHQVLYRVQRSRASPNSVTFSKGTVILPTPKVVRGRFDINSHSVGYFATCAEAALYEAVCRRNVQFVAAQEIQEKALVCFQAKSAIQNLLDIRPHASGWPALQAERYSITQRLANEALAAGFSGIVYKSAQQYDMDCYALWGEALHEFQVLESEPLMLANGSIHQALGATLERSGIALLPF